MIKVILVVFVLTIILAKLALMTKNSFFQLLLKASCIFMFLALSTTTLYTYNTSTEIAIGFGSMTLFLYYFRNNFVVLRSNKKWRLKGVFFIWTRFLI